jgi:hypothetical protein
MFNQYMIMAVANLFRFGFDLLFTLTQVMNDMFFTDSCHSNSEPNMLLSIIFTLVVAIVGDFFPIFMILRIYTLDEKPEEMCGSLLITTAGLGNNSSSEFAD